jgi:hypothetical protein
MNRAEHGTDERDKDEDDVHQTHYRTRNISIEVKQHEPREQKEERVNDYPLAAQHVEERVTEKFENF